MVWESWLNYQIMWGKWQCNSKKPIYIEIFGKDFQARYNTINHSTFKIRETYFVKIWTLLFVWIIKIDFNYKCEYNFNVKNLAKLETQTGDLKLQFHLRSHLVTNICRLFFRKLDQDKRWESHKHHDWSFSDLKT